MKSDFVLAITQLSAEKNLPAEVVIAAVEAALVSAYKKDNFAANQNVSVKINPATGRVKVWVEKEVVERPSDNRREVSLDEAHQIKPDAQLGEMVNVEATPANAGRIAAQTAKQVILQRLHEAEHSAIFEEYADKENDIVTGAVQHIEPKQVFIDLGRTEALLPAAEQVPTERYRVGQRLKVYLLEVVRTVKGPRMIVSRSHPDLLRRLFEMEVPEVFNGTVEIKSIAREAGFRSKVAVAASQEGIDPVGCCVGLRGIRIQNIVNELSGEKIDVVAWNPDMALFIASALSPAQVLSVKLDKDEGVATVVVPDRQLSLAIGKEGQNVRLAAKLVGWRVDVKSASAAEAEKAELERAEAERAEAEELAVAEPTAETEEAVTVDEEVPVGVVDTLEPAPVSAEVEEGVETEEEPAPVSEVEVVIPPVSTAPEKPKKSQLRFAEEVVVPGPVKPVSKSRSKKKSAQGKGREEDDVRLKKRRRDREISVDEYEDEEY